MHGINPFVYDVPLDPDDAVMRHDQVEQLLALAEGSHNTRVSAPRRYGKTTLLRQVQARASSVGYGVVEVDLQGVRSLTDFAVRLELAYRSMRGPLQRVVQGHLSKLRLNLSTPAGSAEVEAESRGGREADVALLQILDLPVRLYKRRGVKTIIVFDEFQDVLTADGAIDAVLRSRIQHHGPAASYIFAGSQPGMLAELFGKQGRPLWGQARAIHLDRLPNEDARGYIEMRFRASDKRLGTGAERLLALADGHPQRLMLLAHHLWEQTEQGATAGEAEWSATVDAVYYELHDLLRRAWKEHDEAEQKVLQTVAAGLGPPFSADVLAEFEMRQTSADKACDRLVDSGDVDTARGGGLRFVDPLFEAWVGAGQRQPPLSLATEGFWERPATESKPGFAFGEPDGSRSDPQDLERHFVSFPGLRLRSGLGLDRTDLRVRVIVGPKGSGKTLYLRRMSLYAQEQAGIYAEPIEFGAAVTTTDVQRVDAWTSSASTVEPWVQCWRAAIVLSATDHVLSSRLRRHVNDEQRTQLALAARSIMRIDGRPASIGQHLRDIVTDHGSSTALQAYLRRPEWDNLEQELAATLADVPPLFLYLDAVDEAFEEAPRDWLACQTGLFHAVMRTLRDGRLGGRLHVVVAIRDLVFASILSTEHATRYVDTANIQVLDWDTDTLRHLLEQKIRRLPHEHLLQPGQDDPVKAWLGTSAVTNRRRDIAEDVISFLLRHTRQSPRDVIVLGNALCDAVAQARRAGQSFLPDDLLRMTVAGVARFFGDEQVRIAANHVAAETIAAPHSAYDGSLDVGKSVSQQLAVTLNERLRELKTDRISHHAFAAWRRQMERDLHPNAGSILWVNRILGYQDPATEAPRFFHPLDRTGVDLPRADYTYLLHPVIIDTIGARGTGRPYSP